MSSEFHMHSTHFFRWFSAVVTMFTIVLNSAAETGTNSFLSSMPEGFFLQEYDDCGVEGRQPHVEMKDAYLWTFGTSDTDAPIKERTAVFSYKGLHAVYTNLNPTLSYALALTYASDHVYKRVQSLEANGVVLHEPIALPQAKAMRVIVPVPPEVVRDGKMKLSWKIHGEVNATVSIIELWANAPSTKALQISSVTGLMESLEGEVTDAAYEGVNDAVVKLVRPGHAEQLNTKTTENGVFSFKRQEVESLAQGADLLLTVQAHGQEGRTTIKGENLFFKPIHYQPLPSKTGDLNANTVSLDGTWRINPTSTNDTRDLSLSDAAWKSIKVPGQWLQQGFDLPQDKPVAMAREFVVPKSWVDQRVMLRFDAIHAGTRYWINGHELGYKENLFTPVEWDITDFARVGQTNRLDLQMTVETLSEKLSYSSGYAFHNLGGIDRSVHLFALPQLHITQLHISPELDALYRDADLNLNFSLGSGASSLNPGLSLVVSLFDAKGKMIKHSRPEMAISSFTGATNVAFQSRVTAPLLWSAEKPNLYHLQIELRKGRTLLERIDRQIGFRKLEIRGRQLYVNDHRVKLAGACHHEFDPLTGRADTARHDETDVRLLKEANLNYIRTSHYPPTTELLDAADRLGMYVEVEAPFCWVNPALDNMSNAPAVLTPTSAMIDFHHSHPSVIVWSLANESHFNRQFLASAKMCKELDPTRPTTFNHDFSGGTLSKVVDIANVHYPPMPFDNVLADDPRPLFLGEYFFPICHEQTDVRIDPGLRELWGMGHAEPDSDFGRSCAAAFDLPPLKPGMKPGGWSYITHSDRVIGGAIWASHDEAFYLSATNHVGYAWHHGFWGLIDCWRRPKPEWSLARHIFSPVWLETRHVDFTPGAKAVRLPVENRFAFTDFSELKFKWTLNRHAGRIHPALAPGKHGELEVPLPSDTVAGDQLHLEITNPAGMIIDECVVDLGKKKQAPLPQPGSQPPTWTDDGNKIVIHGNNFGLVFDRQKGDFDVSDPRHTSAVVAFPTMHLTRYDFGDLNGPNSPNYAVFPEEETRQFEKIEIAPEQDGLRLTVHDHYQDFSGSISWLVDATGRSRVSCDYVYTGKTMDTREAGIRFLLKGDCDKLQWQRWSEWGAFPADSISRTEGSAYAHRSKKFAAEKWNERPAWPWSQDETEMGTADFRSVKYNIYHATLASPKGAGLTAYANADAHFRAALCPAGVTADLLWRCPLGQVSMKSGDHLRGDFVTQVR